MIIDLTVKEIMDLALYSGIELSDKNQPTGCDLEEVVCIDNCPKDGFVDESEGERAQEYYNYVMYFEQCPEEGCIPLGDPINP